MDWVACNVMGSLPRLATDGIGKKTRASLAKGLGGKIWVVKVYVWANTACTRPSEEHRDHGAGSLRVFKQFVWLEAGSDKTALSRPAHQPSSPLPGRSAGVLREG
jgi:hypothetical protein